MTILAGIAALHVIAGLAGGSGTVVTGVAITTDIRMIKSGRDPAAGAMAVITTVAALDVVAGFAGCGGAVVAGEATAADRRVIETYR